MALQGKYNFKGIDLDESYIKVTKVNCNSYSEYNLQEKTAATYNEDGSIKAEAVYENVETKHNKADYVAKVYQSKAKRDENTNNFITEIYGNFDVAVNSTAKNYTIQAYAALKAMAAYKDYTDV